jgi:hypothetical protein
VLVFNRIFNFEPTELARMEQRITTRYTPGAAFPLQAWLLAAGQEWPAKIKDISGSGISLCVEPDAALVEGAAVRVRLRFGAHQQLIEGRIVHLRAEAQGGLQCGVDLKFADFIARKTYLQLLQPILIGQSLVPVAPEQVAQGKPPFVTQVFRGEDNSSLTVWIDESAGAALYGFEFQMQDYFCRVEGKSGILEVRERQETAARKKTVSHPVFDISGTLHAEIRQLFRWTLPNLSAGVPPEVRAFLQRFAG